MSERLGWDRGRRRDNGHLGIRLGWDKFKRNPGYVWQGTISGLRVSTVNGVALIDNAGAVVPTFADGNHSIEIYAAGLMLRGVLASAGTGETLDSEIFTDPSFDADASWVKSAGWTVSGGNADALNVGGGSIRQTKTLSAGGLYKHVTVCSGLSAGTYTPLWRGTYAIPIVAVNTVGTVSRYQTEGLGTAADYGIIGYASPTATFTDISLKKILTPSTAGAVIESARGAADGNWAVNQWVAASYNLSSYEVKIRAI